MAPRGVAMGPHALAAGLLLLGGAGARCALSGEDCRLTRCCARPTERCHEKDLGWASCRQSCTVGTSDHEDDPPQFKTAWSCKELAPPRELQQCAGKFDDCRAIRCCKEPGAQCFEKNAEWAQCKSSCAAGQVDPKDLPHWRTPWTCSLLLPAATHVHQVPAPTPVLHPSDSNATLEALRSMQSEMQSEMRKLKKEMSPSASLAAELAEIQSDLRALQRAETANRTTEEVQAALRGMKDEILPLLRRRAPDAPLAPVHSPLRGMAAQRTPPIPQATAASADAHVQGALPSLFGQLGHLRTRLRWPTVTIVGGLAAVLAFLCIGCLVTGACRGRRAKAGTLKVTVAEEEPLVRRHCGKGQSGDALCEDTWASSEGQDHSVATVLEGQLATLTSELSTLRARSQHLETKYKEAEGQRGGHQEERQRLLGELEAASSRAEEAERARVGLIEEQLRLERDRLAEGAGRRGRCGCSVQ